MNHDIGSPSIPQICISSLYCDREQPPPHGMDGAVPSHGGEGSDYGSDFNSDEEVILHDLFSQIPEKQITSPPLFFKDIEDNEAPRGARMPRILERERHQRATVSSHRNNASKRRIPVEIEGYRSVSAPGGSRRALSDKY